MQRRFVRPRCPSMKEHEEMLAFRKAEPSADSLPERIDGCGYSVRFTGVISGGYSVNVFRSDGSAVAQEVRLRRWGFERSVEDTERDTRIALKLSYNFPLGLTITVLGDGELTAESMEIARWSLAKADASYRIGAGHLLGKLARKGFDVSASVCELATALADSNAKVRANAAWAFGEAAEAGQDISAASDALMKATFDKDALTRVNAANALMAHYASQAESDGAEALLRHKYADVRACARGYLSPKQPLLVK